MSQSQNTSHASTAAMSQQPTLIAPGKIPPLPGDAFKRAISQAIKKFGKQLSGQHLTDFKNTTYDSLCREINTMQEMQQQRKDMMNMSRIQAFLEAMNQFGKVIEIFLNVSEAVAFIWGPMKFLLLTASTFSVSFETLLDAYEQIGEHVLLLAEYEKLFTFNPLMVVALERIYLDILEFHEHAVRFFSKKLWRQFFQSMWNDFDTKFGGILKSLARHKEFVVRSAEIANYSQRQQDSTESQAVGLARHQEYQEDIKELNRKLDYTIAERKQAKTLAVNEWLAVGRQPQRYHEGFCQIRNPYPTTANWILANEDIKMLLGNDVPATPIVWMSGIPGAGKTILTSAIIDKCKENSEFTTSFFYCHEDDQSSNSAIGIIKGLLEQFLEQNPDILPPCHSKLALSGEPVLRSLSHAKKLLSDFCTTIPKLYIIIDGLDECDQAERRQVLNILMEIVAKCDIDDAGKLRIIVVSQDYADIWKALSSSASTRLTPKVIKLSHRDIEKDIMTYVKVWVNKIAGKFAPFPPDMRDYLSNLTLANAKGMFLYSKLVMEDLYSLSTRGDLIEAIQGTNFPKGLKEAYERILKRIRQTSSDDEWVKAKKLLGWMVCAKRRLAWKEIQIALSIDIENQTIEYDDRRFRTHIHDICGSLVSVSGDRVSLVHSTAKTYITKITDEIHEPSVECELATLCLQYLTFPCFDLDATSDPQELQQQALEGYLAFQDYAIAKWFFHVSAFVKSGSKFLEESRDRGRYLDALSVALDEFMYLFGEESWDDGAVATCEADCEAFRIFSLYDNLFLLTSHIYTFRQKGFEAKHQISIKSLATVLERNRKLLEELPPTLNPTDLSKYREFYDLERRFKCTRITCRYFSDGFTDAKAKKKHIDMHNRPYYCEVTNCLGNEGFVNNNDLIKHTRAFHPEMCDLANGFRTATKKSEKAIHSCSICGKTFTRNFHRRDHELSHRGQRPHECPECGKAFTRLNDMRRHKKLHDRQ